MFNKCYNDLSLQLENLEKQTSLARLQMCRTKHLEKKKRYVDNM